MCEGRIVVYRANLDLLVYVVGASEQNELMLASVLDTFCDALSEVIKFSLPSLACNCSSMLDRSWTSALSWNISTWLPLSSMSVLIVGTAGAFIWLTLAW